MKEALPRYFKPILWSHNLSAIDPAQSPNLLISKAINYGDLRHWRWIARHYGIEKIRRTLLSLPAAAIRPGARALAAIVFSLPHANDTVAPRGAHT